MLVVVSLVGGVPVSVVHEVDVVGVRDGLVAAVGTVVVYLRAVLGLGVGSRFALVDVPVVDPVQMPVVDEVGVVGMRGALVPAGRSVLVRVGGVLDVDGGGPGRSSSVCRMASWTMCATCSSARL